ncbi:YbaN family protein [Aquabacterium sp. A7-Y]|uniref:YbaN family protein n=1 Tax=Aquabacterium sp. A7-Y TaxID=1349605 RepID=UPI00223D5806|nr:YbaN family protein [Aquabacterium sp. A7-Y]MCW7540841.1 YbaN family protein [Aquabacterium sp. A7-Y]
MLKRTVTLLWRALALLFILIGVIGVVLPVLPTVPFLLAAAWAAGRGWPQLEEHLLRHPVYGPPICRWRERGVVPRRAKWFASIGMAGSSTMIAFTTAPLWLKAGLPCVLFVVAVWLWCRPEE